VQLPWRDSEQGEDRRENADRDENGSDHGLAPGNEIVKLPDKTEALNGHLSPMVVVRASSGLFHGRGHERSLCCCRLA
jgi:hypothetical protein